MPRTPMTVRQLTGAYPNTPVDIAAEDAFDQANGMTFVATGYEVLILRNPTGAPITYTVPSVADQFGRTGDLTAHSIAAGAKSITGLYKPQGWQQSDGTVHVDAAATGLTYTLLRVQ